MTLIKLPWEYKEYKSAKNKADNDSINLVDKLLIRTREEGSVSSSNDNDDLSYSESIGFWHKGFYVQAFLLDTGQWNCFGKTELPTTGIFQKERSVTFHSFFQDTERKAIKEVLYQIDKFRGVKNNDNKVGRA